MSRLIMPMSTLLLLIPFGCSTQVRQATLDIYWIDVEGGAATLIVTPEQESILMDAGYNRPDERDATRIRAAMTDARILGIDYAQSVLGAGERMLNVDGQVAEVEELEISQRHEVPDTTAVLP